MEEGESPLFLFSYWQPKTGCRPIWRMIMRKTIELTEAEVHALRLALLDRIANLDHTSPDHLRVLRGLEARLTDLAIN